MLWLLVLVITATLAAVAYGWFEAGWLRRRVLEVEVEQVPPELDGLRIAHLSDFHLGIPSRGARAAEAAADWIVGRRPDLVCITGDLVSRRGGIPPLRQLLTKLAPCYVVLGNHDFASSRDPFSQPIAADEISGLDGVTVLGDEGVEIALRGRRVQLTGVDPRSYAARTARPSELADPGCELRILLCHFPGIMRRVDQGVFHMVLSGHMHAGQIVVPLPRRKLRLAHLRAHDVEGVYRYGGTVLHVSPGIGTTFVPLRLFARPEVTELVVRSPR